MKGSEFRPATGVIIFQLVNSDSHSGSNKGMRAVGQHSRLRRRQWITRCSRGVQGGTGADSVLRRKTTSRFYVPRLSRFSPVGRVATL